MNDQIFRCACHSLEHTVILSDEDDFVCLSIHLSQLPFWRRVKTGILYLFGRRSRYGSFDEILLSPEVAANLGLCLLDWSRDKAVIRPLRQPDSPL